MEFNPNFTYITFTIWVIKTLYLITFREPVIFMVSSEIWNMILFLIVTYSFLVFTNRPNFSHGIQN
jgi:hypothetical protein